MRVVSIWRRASSGAGACSPTTVRLLFRSKAIGHLLGNAGANPQWSYLTPKRCSVAFTHRAHAVLAPPPILHQYLHTAGGCAATICVLIIFSFKNHATMMHDL